MKDYKNVFKRYEKKYMLTEIQCRTVLGALKDRITADRYGVCAICNIYYDTENFDLIRKSIDKPVYKEKLRLRSYGVPDKYSDVFVEIKKKYDDVVYKRRESMTLSEAESYLNHGIHPTKQSQILNETDYFMKLHDVMPKVFIAYDRIAYYGNEDKDFRVTFDRNIRYRTQDLSLDYGDFGYPVISRKKVLMEVKFTGAMPLWFAKILSENKIYPTSFSKYGECYSNFICKNTSIGGITCA